MIEAERANELARVEADKAIIQAEKDNQVCLMRSLIWRCRPHAPGPPAPEQAKAEVATQMALVESLRQVSCLCGVGNGAGQRQRPQTHADKVIFTVEGTTPAVVDPRPGHYAHSGYGGYVGDSRIDCHQRAAVGAIQLK